MLKLLQLLFFGHAHKWKILERSPLVITRHPEDGGGVKHRGDRFVLQCETCGKVEGKDIV